MDDGEERKPGVSPSIFDAEGDAAFNALTSGRRSSVDSSLDEFTESTPRTANPTNRDTRGRNTSNVEDLASNACSGSQLATTGGSSGGLEFRTNLEEDENDTVPGSGRLSPYAVKKRPSMVIVYSSAHVVEHRCSLVSELLTELSDLFFAPEAVCTAQRNLSYYCGGHPCSAISAETFAERHDNGDFFVSYQLPMRRPQGSPATVAASTAPSASTPIRGSGSNSPTTPLSAGTSSGQSRRRRQLPSVPSGTAANAAAGASATSPCATASRGSPVRVQVQVQVQVAVVRSSVDALHTAKRNCAALLSLEVAGAMSAAENCDKYELEFIFLTKDKGSSKPFSPDHTVIVIQDKSLPFRQFRNAALVSVGQSSNRTLSPRSLSRVELQARTEWETVATVHLGAKADPDSSLVEDPFPQVVARVAFAEALAFFQSRYQKLKAKHGAFQQLKKPGLFTTKLKPSLHAERDMVYVIANTPFDNSEPFHFRVLQTIYKKLTGDTIDCPRFGNHWQSIGFQGTDPATDLRAAGFLSLLHMLHLVTSVNLLPLALKTYKLSTDEDQNFPFAVLSINLTLMALQALETGVISRLCNKRQQVISCLNDIYTACLLRLYTVWKTERKTIVDSGPVLDDLRATLADRPRQLLSELEKYQTKVWTEASRRRSSTQL